MAPPSGRGTLLASTRWLWAFAVIWTVGIGALLSWHWQHLRDARPGASSGQICSAGALSEEFPGTAMRHGLLWAAGMVGLWVAGGRAAARRRAEEALQASEGRFRAILQTVDLAAVELDRQGRITFCNDFLLALTGWTATDVLGKDWVVTFVPAEDRPRVAAVLQEAVNGGSVPHYENRVVTRRGEERLIRWHNTTVRAVDGTVVGVANLGEDITARRSAQTTLAARTALLEGLRAAGDEMAREVNLAELPQLLIRNVMALLGARSGTVFLWDEAAQELAPYASHGLPEWYREIRHRLGEGVAGTIAATRQGVVVNDYRSSTYAHPQILAETTIQKVMGEPLIARDRLIGVLIVRDKEDGADFGERDQEALQLFAAQAATALENARLVSTLQDELAKRREHEDQLRFQARILDQITETVTVTDLQGTIIYVNDAQVSKLGRSRAQLIGQSVHIYGEDPARGATQREVIERTLKDGAWRGEVVNRGPAGDPLVIEVATFAVRDDAGRPIALCGVGTDITARRAAEEAVRASEAKYRALVDYSPQAILFTRPGGAIVSANPAACRLFGMTEAQICAAGRAGLVDPADTRLAAALEERARIGHAFAQLRLRRGDGGFFDAEVSSAVFQTEAGPGSSVMIQDVTERTRTAAALAASEERFRGIIENAHAGYFRIGQDGCFEFVNSAWLQMHGYAALDEVRGQPFTLTQVPEDVARAERIVRQLLAGQPVPAGEFTRRCRDGSVGSHTFSAYPVRRDGRVVGLEGFLIDTTALQRAQADYGMLFDRMLNGFALHEILCDGEGRPVDYRFLAVNPAFERLTGLTAAALVGRTVREVLPETEPSWVETYGRVALTGEPATFEQRHASLGRHFQVTAFRPAANQFACIFADVTEHKEAEAALRRSHALLEKTFASLRDALFILDTDARIVDCNPMAAKMFGFQREDLLGHTTLPLHVDEAALAAFREALGVAVRRHGFLDGYEFRMKRHNGEIFPTEHTVVPLEDAQGQRLGWVSRVRDLTEVKRVQQALRRNEAELAAVYDHAPLVMCLVDRERRVRRVNATALRMTGRTEAEALGLRGGDLLGCVTALSHAEGCGYSPDCTACPLRLAVLDTLETGRRCERVEARKVLQRDGQRQEVVLLASSAPIVVGTDTLALVCFEDVTEQRRLGEQLRQAQKLEAIGQLAGGIAHDFNNILTASLMRLTLLQSEPALPAAVQAELGELEQDSLRAADLTRQLLAFSRRQVAQMKPLEVNQLLANLLKMLRRLLGEPITVEFAGGADEIWVTADAGMLEQVIVNLVVNARDAMPTGGRLTISARMLEISEADARRHAEASAGRFACLAIADTGCGMDPATLPRVFEPFFTTKEVGKGTGLGLATVYGIVKQHRGWIEVESQVGAGSIFRVFLPTSAPEPAAAGTRVATAAHEHETILLVEDDARVRQPAAAYLRHEGYVVIEAVDGDEALQQWREHAGTVDVLVSDLVMPGGVSGFELAARLRRERPSLRIILTSGYSPDAIKGGLPRGQGISFLPKPFRPNVLAEAIRRSFETSPEEGGQTDR